MIRHSEISNIELRISIRHEEIALSGNMMLKIYGVLHCSTGKRMNKENRVFFKSKEEATATGFRACGLCMRSEYKKWKNDLI